MGEAGPVLVIQLAKGWQLQPHTPVVKTVPNLVLRLTRISD
jgi:hypothetical protein